MGTCDWEWVVAYPMPGKWKLRLDIADEASVVLIRMACDSGAKHYSRCFSSHWLPRPKERILLSSTRRVATGHLSVRSVLQSADLSQGLDFQRYQSPHSKT